MRKTRGTRTRSVAWSSMIACCGGVLAAAVWAPGAAVGVGLGTLAATSSHAEAQTSDAPDLVVFHDGRSVRGTILSESASQLRMRIVFRGIVSETTYDRGDVASITRGTSVDESADEKKAETKNVVRAEANRYGRGAGTPATAPTPDTTAQHGGGDGARVYVMELTGAFGKDISETPIRQALEDAKKLEADYIVVKMDNTWSDARGLDELDDDAAAFDEIFEAESMARIFYEEIPQQWEQTPKVVFWVKRAMGGAAFLPMCVEDIYFDEDGKMGGIGNLGELFSSGDEVVKEKQYSLRLNAAEGIALLGNHNPKLVEAMARREYVLWMRRVGSDVRLISNPALVEESDILLTDDGEGENKDTDEQIVRGQGNDVLTLTAGLAFDLGVSKETVSSLDDLLFELGIERQAEVLEGRSDKIMRLWRQRVKLAEKELEELWEEFNEAGGNGNDRANPNAIRISKAREMIKVLRRFEEAINPGQIGVPGIAQLELQIEQLKLANLADRN